MENKATDALSRLSIDTFALATISIGHLLEGDIIDKKVHFDKYYKAIIQDLLWDPMSHANFLLKNGTSFYKGILVLTLQFIVLPVL